MGNELRNEQFKIKKKETLMCKIYYDATEISEMLGISKTTAYGIIKKLNKELEKAGYILEEYPERKIEVVDSLSAGLGEGLLVLRAIECRDQGMTLAETFQKINKMKHSIFQVFFVDDLMYLKHTGRISGAVAAVGSILGIKPLLKGDPHGRIVACGKVRGRQQAIKALAEKYFTLAKNAVEQTVAITHTNCLKDAELLKDMLMAKLPPKKLILLKHEPATGSHLGPGALALFFEGDSDVRTR